jgi:hypothetical protein
MNSLPNCEMNRRCLAHDVKKQFDFGIMVQPLTDRRDRSRLLMLYFAVDAALALPRYFLELLVSYSFS